MSSYTFGDNEEASRRLQRLAEVYEPETRALLSLVPCSEESLRLRLAVDLGCGPGWSTQLLYSVLKPQRTIGLETSELYIAEARTKHPQLEFFPHDVLRIPFPVEAPNLLFCRFLLTHLPSPKEALNIWADAAAHHALLLIHETEAIESNHPSLRRYYELVGEMQRHYGQNLNVGADLDACFAGTAWTIEQSRSLVLEKPAQKMAQLHLPNLRTWRRNEYASQAFDRHELDELETALDQIACGIIDAGSVSNIAKQIVAERQ